MYMCISIGYDLLPARKIKADYSPIANLLPKEIWDRNHYKAVC